MNVVVASTAAAVALALGAASPETGQDVAPPLNVTAPAILGEPALGSTLTTDGGTWRSAVPISRTYAWQACDAQGANCQVIQYETEASYVPKYFQVKGGDTVRSVVTAWNIAGNNTAVSTPVTVRGATAVMLEAPQLQGDARVGGTLTVTDGSWTSVEPWHLTREWLRCWPDEPASCTVIPYGLGPTLLVGPRDAGWLVEARVTAKTRSGATVVTTAPVAIPGPPPAHLTVHDRDLGTLTLGQPYDLALWDGGAAPYEFAAWGSVPTGMSVTATGHLAGRPSELQDISFGGDVTQAGGAIAHGLEFHVRVITQYVAKHHLAAFATNVYGPAPSSGPCALEGATDPQAPALNGEVEGWDLHVGLRTRIPLVQFGTPPYRFCTLSGALPPGLTVDPTSGAVIGAPTKAGGYTVTYAIADAARHAGPASVTIGFIVAPRPTVKHRPKARHRKS